MVALFRRFRRSEVMSFAAESAAHVVLPLLKTPNESFVDRLRRSFGRSGPVSPVSSQEDKLHKQLTELKQEYAKVLKDPSDSNYDAFLSRVKPYNDALKQSGQLSATSAVPALHNQLVKQLRSDENYLRAKARDSIEISLPKSHQNAAPDPLSPPPPLEAPPPLTAASAEVLAPTPKPASSSYGQLPPGIKLEPPTAKNPYGFLPAQNAGYDRVQDPPTPQSAYGRLLDDEALRHAAITDRKGPEPRTNYASMPPSLSVANAQENNLAQVRASVREPVTNGASSQYGGMPAREEVKQNPKAIYVGAPKQDAVAAPSAEQYGSLPNSPDIKLHYGQLSLSESKHDAYSPDYESTPNNAAVNLRMLYAIKEAIANGDDPRAPLAGKDIHQLASLQREMLAMSATERPTDERSGANLDGDYSQVAEVVNSSLAEAVGTEFGDNPTFNAGQFTTNEYFAMGAAMAAVRTEDNMQANMQASKNLFVMQMHQEAADKKQGRAPDNLYQIMKMREFAGSVQQADREIGSRSPGWDDAVSTVQNSSGEPISLSSLQQDNDGQLVEAALNINSNSSRQVYGEGFLKKLDEELQGIEARTGDVEAKWASGLVKAEIKNLEAVVTSTAKKEATSAQATAVTATQQVSTGNQDLKGVQPPSNYKKMPDPTPTTATTATNYQSLNSDQPQATAAKPEAAKPQRSFLTKSPDDTIATNVGREQTIAKVKSNQACNVSVAARVAHFETEIQATASNRMR